ncbi:MAG: threonylcarbamoyl-AMP synthase [Chloroflexi bacterium]|nr:threonylcarbamoyl-AMP synthase [Chloroflexota bacterium]
MVEVVQVDPVCPDPTVLARAGDILRQGGLVAFPTETVYGLGANALDERAVHRIYAAKQRDPNDPLIVHLGDAAELSTVAASVLPPAAALGERFWPGPLTLVLPKQPVVPDAATAGLPTVAVRVPSHPVAHGLIVAAGVPIAAPSANLFTRASATTAAHVVEDLGGRVDLILDGGPASYGIESTVVAVEEVSEAPLSFDQNGQRVCRTVEHYEARLLRPGATTAEEIAAALSALDPPVPLLFGAAGRTASPGLLAKHYSPRATLYLVTGDDAEARAALRSAVERGLTAGRRAGVLMADEDVPAFSDLGGRICVEHLGSTRDLGEIARRLFAALRSLDAAGCNAIYARSFGSAGLGLAILDRLTRAAHRDADPSANSDVDEA